MLELFCVLLLAQAPEKKEPANTQWKLHTTENRSFEAELTFRVNLEGGGAKDWGFFISKAPELPTQKNVETIFQVPTAVLKPSYMKDFSPLQRDVIFQKLVAKEKIQQESAQAKLTYKGDLSARNLVPLPPGESPPMVSPLKEAEKKLALAEFGDIRFKDKDFKNWMENLDCIRKPDERDLDFARKAFHKIHYKVDFEASEKLDRKSTTVSLMGKSDSGGISNLFVAVLRANNIPARTLWGRWTKTGKEMEKINGVAYHQMGVRCEFFADGIGWVSADPGSALFIKPKKGDPNQFFGIDYGTFFVQHVDPSFDVVNPLTNRRLQMISLQVPAYWFTTSGMTLPKVTYFHEWKVTKGEIK